MQALRQTVSDVRDFGFWNTFALFIVAAIIVSIVNNWDNRKPQLP